MTREHAKAIAPIIAAFGDGENVQYRNNSGEWDSTDEYGLSFELSPESYRLAPKPRKVWVNEYADEVFGNTHQSQSDASSEQIMCSRQLIACHEIELPPLP
jgi:hypothetical protein